MRTVSIKPHGHIAVVTKNPIARKPLFGSPEFSYDLVATRCSMASSFLGSAAVRMVNGQKFISGLPATLTAAPVYLQYQGSPTAHVFSVTNASPWLPSLV